jgi:type II secretory pathway predicted ATPase ExeA
MYESYYGFTEKPFSLTPDPKYLYRSESHANAFDLLQYAVRRREGFVVVTGDIGTGKTTLCRALLEQIDRTTFTALVLNPFLSEEELLKRVLQDFGVVSREDVKAGRLAGASTHELIDALYDFLLGLVSRDASAVLIIDEAQNLPLPLLEQIRILSNLETDKEKLLQIILVGQLNLQALLRSPNLRQLDQRVSIRYELAPLDADTVAAYVAHRLTIAGGSTSVAFTAKALVHVHRLSGGIPRLINLICDRALLAGYSAQANRITPEMVLQAAESLDIRPRGGRPMRWLQVRTPLIAPSAVVLLAATLAVGATTLLYQRFGVDAIQASALTTPVRGGDVELPPRTRTLPADATLTVLAASYPVAPESDAAVAALTAWLEDTGYPVYHAQVDLGAAGRWHRILAGAYTDRETAAAAAARLGAAAPGLHVQVMAKEVATGTTW